MSKVSPQVTSWTLINIAVHGQPWERREAMEKLLTQYLPAIRAFLLAKAWVRPDDIDDTVQEFIKSQVLERQLINRVDRNKGKFRSYLLTSLRYFIINELRRKKPTTSDLVIEPSDDDTPDRTFDREWARLVIQEALTQMKRQCNEMGRSTLWGLFEYRLLGPIFNATPAPAYSELVEKFDLKSPGQAANLLVTAKRIFTRILRETIAQYTHDDEGIDQELADLLADLATQ